MTQNCHLIVEPKVHKNQLNLSIFVHLESETYVDFYALGYIIIALRYMNKSCIPPGLALQHIHVRSCIILVT